MEMEVSQFLADMEVPVKKFGVRELRKREEIWRALWSWLDDDAKYLLIRVGTTVRILKRDYKGAVGELGAVKFEAKEYELAVYEKVYNYNDGKYYFERKVLKIPSGTVMMLEFIQSQEEESAVNVPEVEGFEEEALELL